MVGAAVLLLFVVLVVVNENFCSQQPKKDFSITVKAERRFLLLCK
jgi:hypothetical protein